MHPTKVLVLGMGMGPQHVTNEVAEALYGCDYVLGFDKSANPEAHGGRGHDPLFAARAAVCERRGGGLVAVPEPALDRTGRGYPSEVREWHEARVAACREVVERRGGVVGLVAWGDPALYDSTVRIARALAEQVGCDWEVLPGISAPQLLAARHRIVLNEVGGAVHVTTARRLHEDVAAGQRNLVVMLGGDPDLAGLEDWTIWWGANLGAPGEQLAHGTVREVAGGLSAARERARERDGWVMDLCLLRAPKHSGAA